MNIKWDCNNHYVFITSLSAVLTMYITNLTHLNVILLYLCFCLLQSTETSPASSLQSLPISPCSEKSLPFKVDQVDHFMWLHVYEQYWICVFVFEWVSGWDQLSTKYHCHLLTSLLSSLSSESMIKARQTLLNVITALNWSPLSNFRIGLNFCHIIWHAVWGGSWRLFVFNDPAQVIIWHIRKFLAV